MVFLLEQQLVKTAQSYSDVACLYQMTHLGRRGRDRDVFTTPTCAHTHKMRPLWVGLGFMVPKLVWTMAQEMVPHTARVEGGSHFHSIAPHFSLSMESCPQV